MRWLFALALLARLPLCAGTAADIARAIRENSFDRDECYRVRDLTITKDELRIYLTDGHLTFSKPVAGRRIAAIFTTDVDGGDGEVLMLPPNRAERRSLAKYAESPNLDDHFSTALFIFTGNDYDALKSQLPSNPANKKAPELGPLLDEAWTSVLRSLGSSYQTRLTLDLMGGPGRSRGLFVALISSPKLGNYDFVFDPDSSEQIKAGQVLTRDNRLYFDTWASFVSSSFRNRPAPVRDLAINHYRIEATVHPDYSLTAVTRIAVKPAVDGMIVVPFDIAPEIQVSEVKIDGREAEVLQRDSLRADLARGGNTLFLVVPPEPLRAGREYEFEFHHAGQVIHDAGDGVLFVSARADWYPLHGLQFSDYDLLFRYPANLDLVTPGDAVEDRTEGDWRITRRHVSSPIRVAGFNLGNYQHARLEHGKYVVDVCANRTLETGLQPRPIQLIPLPTPPGLRTRRDPLAPQAVPAPPPNPLERLRDLASGIASALDFMASKFGPPALPHLTVSPIPGAFGQGFPGLIYLSTLSYLKRLPTGRGQTTQSQELFFQEVLEAHETAHQWWGNRVFAASYRDTWLMEALANYAALLYLENVKGPHAVEILLDSYRTGLLEKNAGGQIVDSTGPIVLGPRLENSQEPRAYIAITYGKGTWILQMLRRRMGDERFLSLLSEILKRYDRQDLTTEKFQQLAAQFMPAKSDDATLDSFFEQWVYGTGIPSLKLSYSIKGKAPALRLVGTITQSDVDEDFTVLVPVEIQVARGRTVTQWVRTSSEPAIFTLPLKQAPGKVTLDPQYAVLRR